MAIETVASRPRRMGRRRLLASGAAVLATARGASADEDDAAARHDARLPRSAPTLFYVSAPDCPYCTKWNHVFRASFEASDVRDRLRFVPLATRSVRVGWSNSEVWPTDSRWVWTELERRQIRHVVPLFVLVQKGAYLASMTGYDQNSDYGWAGGFYGQVLRSVGMA
jgi:hypothetical protein